MTLQLVLLQEQPTVVLLLERALVSWLSAIDERSEHKDLCGSRRRSVIPYIHGRMELYCPSLALPVGTRAIYSSRSGSYNESQSPT
jgi:hypothetical protein